MIPIFISMNSPYRFYIYLKGLCYKVLGKPIGLAHSFYSFYVKLREFAIWVFNPGKTSLFRDHIFHVSWMVANKQMVRSNAKPIVTSMQYAHSIWNGAYVYLPRGSRCYSILGIYFSSGPKSPVTMFIYSANPFPAVIRFFNSFPESFVYWSRYFAFFHMNTMRMFADDSQAKHVGSC